MRKGQEAIITYFMERELSKRRILELYLNVIEWGDGIYGAEAASQYYFHKPAANLNAREGAFLSAMIPNPRTVFNPQVNPKRVARRQRIILRGMPSVKMPAGTGGCWERGHPVRIEREARKSSKDFRGQPGAIAR